MLPGRHLALLGSVLLFLTGTHAAARGRRFARNNNVMTGFNARDCGGSNADIKFHGISVNPRPIVVPGEVRVGVNVAIRRDIPGTMLADIQVSRKLDLGWFGYFWLGLTPSCSDTSCMTDLCAVLQQKVDLEGCPSETIENGFNCTCPPLPGSYVTRRGVPIVVDITEESLPPEFMRDMITGTYKVRSTIYDSSGARLGCFVVEYGVIHDSSRG